MPHHLHGPRNVAARAVQCSVTLVTCGAESPDLPPQAPDLLLTGFGLRGLRGPLPLELLGQPAQGRHQLPP